MAMNNDHQELEEEEEDFMSDRFLKQITESAPPVSDSSKTYSEKRKRKLLEVSKTHQKRSRAHREMEAREEGLSRNLIRTAAQPDNPQPETHSKAFQMMLKMGFQPGTSLGVSTTSNPSNEPITIIPKSDRAGIGITPKPLSAAKLPRLLFGAGGKLNLTVEEAAQREAFLSASRTRFDGRKVDAILGRACRTCEELDRRRGLESNIFWTAQPSQDERESRLTTLDKLVSENSDNDHDDLLDHDAHIEEQQNWLALEPSTRLSCTLGYLREEYFYCIWCGCQYESLEELNQECPGEEEDDH
ncbi:hypothetical protein PCANC_24952 [Puccinia coronata f. sp. avenae]|uniref:G-patch domain-containing protein n=1 Tax=Puccinia coronata f. sp. avenae TaxID=200324 RepID=A0A2N5S8R4_9BASI|nr:hypothetical protein PCANC_24952 [Puccinia coronata f. sp. avenae]